MRDILKIIFYSLAAAMLIVLLLASRDAGISGDEEVHMHHAGHVYDYYASLGKDQDAIDTPATHLQHYGQSPDNIAYILSRWLGINDVYGFRHLFSSLIGWATIFITACFARWLKGYGAAIITLLVFAVSPRFLGHLQNNLKDIPFALAYIAGLYYILKLTYAKFNARPSLTIVLLIVSIAFSVSIRAGGILLVLYLFLAALIYFILEFRNSGGIDWPKARQTVILLFIISVSGYLLGLLLWPYALQNPVVNPWKSYRVMTHFPTTIQQIFEGRFMWSDMMPWHYLPKYMVITIPLIVFAGILLFAVLGRRVISRDHRLTYSFIVFAIVFPVFFAVITDANLYGAWRHFIFVYPPMVLIAATGLHETFVHYRKPLARSALIIITAALAIHPVKFMITSHPWYYLYYNQLVGGLGGAYGKYETDYYYHTMRAGAEWLKTHISAGEDKGEIVVGSNFPVDWYFRDTDNIRFRWFPYSRRNDVAWDYAIIGNSYVSPSQLMHFPPEDVIHEVLVDGRPMCVVLSRSSNLPAEGARAFECGDYEEAAALYGKATEYYQNDEHIYYKLGKSLYLCGENEEAAKAASRSLAINGNYGPALELAGQIKMAGGDSRGAKRYFEKLTEANRKYFRAYTQLADIYVDEGEQEKAREILRECLRINPRYKPAIMAMGKTFESSAPDIANKYYEHANSFD